MLICSVLCEAIWVLHSCCLFTIQCPSQAQKIMFLGNVIRAKPHEKQDRSPDSKQEENVYCEKQSLLSRPLCSYYEKYCAPPQSKTEEISKYNTTWQLVNCSYMQRQHVKYRHTYEREILKDL